MLLLRIADAAPIGVALPIILLVSLFVVAIVAVVIAVVIISRRNK
jgi:Mn2+/Fe2+ NRAMP family transporter